MLFPSEVFLYLFLPVVLLLYFVVPQKWRGARNAVLLIASLFFYAWGEGRNVLLLVGVAMLDFWSALGIARVRAAAEAASRVSDADQTEVAGQRSGKDGKPEAGRRVRLDTLILVAALILNLSTLFWYKYAGFAAAQLVTHLHLRIPVPAIALPIGISFFTFQAMSYLIDVYRGRYPAEKNPLHVMLYVALFPQLIAGPIVRYEEVAADILERRENWSDFSMGVTRFCIGLAKKVLLANQMAQVADGIFALLYEGRFASSVATAWLGAVCYSLQIYFDFSGYSDMAIGLGRMFGFTFDENFRYPYISRSITEFWRRWHISLQTWFRDYVYIPLGGSRTSRWRWIFNVCLVWVLTGIWHGASWTYLLWGLLQLVALFLERVLHLSKNHKWWGLLYTLPFTAISMAVFRSTGLRTALIYLKAMCGMGATALHDAVATAYLRQYGAWILLAMLASIPVLPATEERLKGRGWWNALYAAIVGAALLLSLSYIANNAYNPFIYFQF